MPEQTRPARGMRDFLPEDVRRRDYVIGVVEDVYRRYGFEPLETPALENIETLTGKYGEEGAKLIFKVLRRGEHEASGETDLALALRPDGAARARGCRASREAAALLQAVPDSAGVARGPPGARPVPRVLPVRRRRDWFALAGRRSGGVRGDERRAAHARFHRFRDPAEPPRPPPRHARKFRRSGGVARSGARRRSTSSRRSATTVFGPSSRRGASRPGRSTGCWRPTPRQRRRGRSRPPVCECREARTRGVARRGPRGRGGGRRESGRDRAPERGDERRGSPAGRSEPGAWPVGTTPARSWRSRFPTLPAASAAAGATTG